MQSSHQATREKPGCSTPGGNLEASDFAFLGQSSRGNRHRVRPDRCGYQPRHHCRGQRSRQHAQYRIHVSQYFASLRQSPVAGTGRGFDFGWGLCLFGPGTMQVPRGVANRPAEAASVECDADPSFPAPDDAARPPGLVGLNRHREAVRNKERAHDFERCSGI